MGAGSSVGSDVLELEAARPLDASDVHTPRGESAKHEVARLRQLLAAHLGMPVDHATRTEAGGPVAAAEEAVDGAEMAPGLEAYLASLFRAADVDESGVLSAGEFWQLLQGSDLGLTPDQIAALQAQAQWSAGGEQGDVTWALFVELAPHILANLHVAADGSAESDAADAADDAGDWCALSTADGGVYYYNKRTQASAWEPPASWPPSQ